MVHHLSSKGYAICKLRKTINEYIFEHFKFQVGGPFHL